jgi:hypothetical protein
MQKTRQFDRRRKDRDRPPRCDAYTRDRDRRRADRDASAGWREEYRHAGAALPDGGRELDTPAPADRVRDRGGDDRDELIVLEVRDVRADEERIDALPGSPTVAEVNPEFDPGAPVVDAVYVADLERLEAWRSIDDLRDAVDADALRSYTFPADRLAPGEEGEPEP